MSAKRHFADDSPTPVSLTYIGDGNYIPGVPAADHTVASVAEAKRLVESGLYRLAKPDKPTDAKSAAAPKQENPDGE